MDAFLGFISAAALVAAICAIAYVVADAYTIHPVHAAPVAAPRTAMCVPDGVAITSQHVLAMYITSLDRMLATGRAPDGTRVTPLDVAQSADRLAQAQRAPLVVLDMLNNCEGFQGRSYGIGVFQAALIRASVARRRAAGLQ
jgi:hypothetical protein